MLKFFSRLRRNEEGQAMVEYALILALVSVVSIIALTAIGVNVTAIFQAIADKLATVTIP
jgi:pilus assembly protein Flp/PilA